MQMAASRECVAAVCAVCTAVGGRNGAGECVQAERQGQGRRAGLLCEWICTVGDTDGNVSSDTVRLQGRSGALLGGCHCSAVSQAHVGKMHLREAIA